MLSGEVFGELLEQDLSMVIFSVLFVYIWMFMHTESFWIANVGMFQIFMSLPFSRLFYSIIGQVAYFSTLQVRKGALLLQFKPPAPSAFLRASALLPTTSFRAFRSRPKGKSVLAYR